VAKIKHTKNELKSQREALSRFERFLPMLQLKKQQLRVEIQAIEAKLSAKTAEDAAIRTALDKWVSLFSEPIDIESIVTLISRRIEPGNIAGVAIPVLAGADMKTRELDLFLTPPWMDEAAEVIRALITLRIEREVLQEQKRLIQDELRTTSQRVNLFEKVKIPESRENIRVIKIFLGDEQTAGVVRGKIAKGRAEVPDEMAPAGLPEAAT
jgi:V/A-type H+/Na+-transporting ATPase subunit D